MYKKTARFYDLIYGFKDYKHEVDQLQQYIHSHVQHKTRTLLDVACGTGGHIPYLKKHYHIEGLDLDEGMVAIARERFPSITFHHANMIDFNLNKEFDIVTCLFSSIGYVQTVENLNASIANFARHIKAGGVVIVEPWFSHQNLKAGHIGLRVVDEPDIKIVRMSTIKIKNGISYTNFQYLIGENPSSDQAEIYHDEEIHELALFSHDQYVAAFEKAGLSVIHDEYGLIGRGLYMGMKPT